ncbi:5512_t:CDS:2 [Ambispora gerdemannii]|uniref:5512_t:CDS:1 n=1 Tax=Ambispora gerdemannii TaxID=144530 RepID=A0A9N8Z4X8_9GLOM|nr:5512_t:CDS:2 [Ambispora gerdemannii]
MASPATSSTDDVNELIQKMNRNNIFSPQLKNPEELVAEPRITETGSLRPPRPQNAFFLFRKNVLAEARRFSVQNMRIISKVASILWQQATNNEKQMYKDLANKVSVLHRQRYPKFRYTENYQRTRFRRHFLPNAPPSPDSNNSNDAIEIGGI